MPVATKCLEPLPISGPDLLQAVLPAPLSHRHAPSLVTTYADIRHPNPKAGRAGPSRAKQARARGRTCCRCLHFRLSAATPVLSVLQKRAINIDAQRHTKHRDTTTTPPRFPAQNTASPQRGWTPRGAPGGSRKGAVGSSRTHRGGAERTVTLSTASVARRGALL